SFHGEANTKWEETHGSGDSTVTYTYSAITPYVTGSAVVWTPPSGKSTAHLPLGNHRFPFKFLLPLNCPPSFQGGNGCIRYYCKAIIYRPWYSADQMASRRFIVKRPSDLNLIPEVCSPLQRSGSKEIKFLCRKKGYIGILVRVPKRGFVPGEIIAFEAEIVNCSSQTIENERNLSWAL
ncbi:hypothetical protein PMAYCL1PPCAC_24819, partial [Pristionchus mayeri]